MHISTWITAQLCRKNRLMVDLIPNNNKNDNKNAKGKDY